jgi:hypothetical protein
MEKTFWVTASGDSPWIFAMMKPDLQFRDGRHQGDVWPGVEFDNMQAAPAEKYRGLCLHAAFADQGQSNSAPISVFDCNHWAARSS